MFGLWMNIMGGKLRQQLLAGASAFCWAIWLSRNDVVFNKSPIKYFLQVLYRGTNWLLLWSQLERNEQDRVMIHLACRKLKIVVMQIFVNHG